MGLVAALIAEALAPLRTADGRPLHVLDCGGGSGAFAVRLASPDTFVTVVDISADALTTLSRRAADAGVAAYVEPRNGDVEALQSLIEPASVDAVLAHGVLDAVERPEQVLGSMADALRPGGVLSVLVSNPVASVVSRAIGGEPADALAELRGLDTEAGVPGPDDVEATCRHLGLEPATPQWRHGIGVFSDLVPGAALDSAPAREAVQALDVEASGRLPFAELAGRIHLVFRRPG